MSSVAGLFLTLGLLAAFFIMGGKATPGSGLTAYGNGILLALVMMAMLVVIAWSYGRARSSEGY